MIEPVEINKVIYPIQRFKTLGYLCQVESAGFRSIGDFTGLSSTDISKTIRTLEEHGYVSVIKRRQGRYPETIVAATDMGRSEMVSLITALKRYARG